MANYSNLKAAIADVIKTNGTKAITGQVLQDTLNSIVSVIGANYQFAGVATPATNPRTPDQNVFYIAMQGGMYTNFNATALPDGISLLMWNGSWSSQVISYNDGGVFDISVYKSTGGTLATFADLAAALGTNGANVPVAARKGGMSVRFVQSSDNKYVQFRCMAQSFTTDTTQWQGVDEEPTAGSENLVKSGGVAEDSNLIHSILSKDVLYTLEAGEYKEDGDAADNYYRVRTKNSIPASSWTLEVNSGYLIHRICYYNQDGTFNKYVNGNTQYSGLKFISTENLIARITFRNSAGTHLEPTENIISSFKFDYNVNDEVSALKTNLGVATADINNISNEIYGGSININSITFTRGGINSSTGVPQPDVNFASANTDQYFDKRKHTIVCNSTLYKIFRVYRYNDTNGDFVDAENINVTTYVNNGDYYSKYEFVRLDGNNFADAHPTGLLTSVTYNLGIKGQLNGLSFWKGTQAEYDALGTYDNNTVYFIY